jgi:hypothetical protein
MSFDPLLKIATADSARRTVIEEKLLHHPEVQRHAMKERALGEVATLDEQVQAYRERTFEYDKRFRVAMGVARRHLPTPETMAEEAMTNSVNVRVPARMQLEAFKRAVKR